MSDATRPPLSLPLDSRWRDAAPREWLEQWAPKRFAVAGGEVDGVEIGDGPPLLLLPPLPGWKESFVAVTRILARRFRVIAFDLRARFPAGTDPWAQLVEDAARIASDRAGAPAVVLGHSLGAALALRLAIERPAAVRALVLSSGFARVFTPPGALAARWIEQPAALAAMRLFPDALSRRFTRGLAARSGWVFDPRCDAATIELVRLGVRSLPLAHVRQCVRLALCHDVRASLSRVAVPTLLLCGERDTPFARAATAELAAAMPHSTRAEVPGAGHLHPLSAAGDLAGIVTGWLDKLGNGGGDFVIDWAAARLDSAHDIS